MTAQKHWPIVCWIGLLQNTENKSTCYDDHDSFLP